MPDPNRDPNHMAGLFLSRIPAEVRKCISGDEAADRAVEAMRLSSLAADPGLSAETRQGYRDSAQAVLAARPRDVVAKEARALIAKADAIVGGGAPAELLRLRAERLVGEHPIAPRRSAEAGLEGIRQGHRARVAKAKKAEKDPPVPVFDADGNLIGVCDADDIMPVAGAGKKADAAAAPAPAQPAGQAAGAAAADAAPVAKAADGRVFVWDQHGRRYLTHPRSIHRRIAKAGDDDMVTMYDAAGRAYQVPSSAIRSAEDQARDTGPVSAGGTTGMGQPRMTGPAAALPGDGPQARLRGGVADRTVVKAGPAGPGRVRTVGDAARDRRLARIEKATGLDLRLPHVYARNIYSAGGHCVCEAPLVHQTHTGITNSLPVDFRGVAKATWSPELGTPTWSPGLGNRATEQWLASRLGRR
jgi:hypothetical protein